MFLWSVSPFSWKTANSIKVPLAEMEYNGEGKRPTGVSEEVFEKYASPDPLDVFGTTAFEVTSFSGNENAR